MKQWEEVHGRIFNRGGADREGGGDGVAGFFLLVINTT